MMTETRSTAACAFIAGVVALGVLFSSCAYFNLFYNAKNSFRKAQEAKGKRKGDEPTREELNLYDEAIKKCGLVIASYPKSKWVDDAILIMGRSFYEKGMYEQAIVKFSELREEFPESELNEDGTFFSAKAYLGKEDRARAVEVLQDFLASYKKSKFREEALYLLGTNLIQEQGGEDRAAEVLAQLSREYPKGVFTRKAKIDMARLFLAKGEYERSASLYREVLASKANSAMEIEAKIELARAYNEMGKYGEALAIAGEMDEEVLKPAKKAQQMLIEAAAYAGLDSLSRSIDIYRSVAARFPKSNFAAEAYFRLGRIYQDRLDSLETARGLYDKVTKAYAKSDLAREAVKRSSSISKLLRFRKSLGEGKEEEQAEKQYMLAEMQLFQFDNPLEALDEYRKVIDKFPASALAAKAAYAIAYIYDNILDDSAKAISSFRFIIEKYPNSEQAKYVRRILEKKGVTVAGDTLQ